jgi:hypothetical protein
MHSQINLCMNGFALQLFPNLCDQNIGFLETPSKDTCQESIRESLESIDNLNEIE